MSETANGRDLTERGWPWLVFLLFAGYTLWTYGELRVALLPSWQDTQGYLSHALYIAERGGFIGFLRESFAGTFPITERHPLYMLLLAPFASREEQFFWIAKMVSLVTSLAVLASIVWMVKERYGRWPALLTGLVYAMSRSLVVAASHVDNEPQFVLCALWAWWFLTEPARADSSARESTEGFPAAPLGMPQSIGRWILGGVFVGLAYLAKSPAILIAFGVFVGGPHASALQVPDQRALLGLPRGGGGGVVAAAGAQRHRLRHAVLRRHELEHHVARRLEPDRRRHVDHVLRPLRCGHDRKKRHADHAGLPAHARCRRHRQAHRQGHRGRAHEGGAAGARVRGAARASRRARIRLPGDGGSPWPACGCGGARGTRCWCSSGAAASSCSSAGTRCSRRCAISRRSCPSGLLSPCTPCGTWCCASCACRSRSAAPRLQWPAPWPWRSGPAWPAAISRVRSRWWRCRPLTTV